MCTQRKYITSFSSSLDFSEFLAYAWSWCYGVIEYCILGVELQTWRLHPSCLEAAFVQCILHCHSNFCHQSGLFARI